MRSSLSLFAVPLLVGCTHYWPAGLDNTSMPPMGDYGLAGYVRAEKCTSRLFGIIPLDDGVTMDELYFEAKGDNDFLVEILYTMSHDWWVLGNTDCYHIIARGAKFSDQPTRSLLSSAAGVGSESPTTALAQADTPPVAPDPKLPPEIDSVARRVFEAVGLPVQSDPDLWQEEALLVWAFYNTGLSEEALVIAARKGVEKIGAEHRIDALVVSGLTE